MNMDIQTSIVIDQATQQLLEEDMLPNLTPSASPDVKSIAMRYFLEMTGSKEGQEFIAKGKDFIPAIISLATDSQADAAKDAFLALINLTAKGTISWKHMHTDADPRFVYDILLKVLNPNFQFSEEACNIVYNVIQQPSCVKLLAKHILEDNPEVTIAKLVNVLCQVKNAEHYLGPILSKLTEVSDIKKILTDQYNTAELLCQKLCRLLNLNEHQQNRNESHNVSVPPNLEQNIDIESTDEQQQTYINLEC